MSGGGVLGCADGCDEDDEDFENWADELGADQDDLDDTDGKPQAYSPLLIPTSGGSQSKQDTKAGQVASPEQTKPAQKPTWGPNGEAQPRTQRPPMVRRDIQSGEVFKDKATNEIYKGIAGIASKLAKLGGKSK